MKKILIAEDDEFFRLALKNVLVDGGFEIVEAPNGKTAKEIINMSSFDLIISDVQMPYFDGIDLLKWVKENKPMPFILMTGFAHILETQSAFDLGADDFIAKPFEEDDLLEKINSILKPLESSEPEAEPKPIYCKVSLEDFVTDKNIEMDVFIKLSDSKYLKILHQGGKISSERIEKYKEKGVEQLYIKKDDFHKIIEFNVKLSKLVAANSSIPKEKRDRFLNYTGETILESTFCEGVDTEAFDSAKEFLTTSVDLLTRDEQTFDLLEILNSHNDFLYAHCLGVSMYSVMISKELGWTSSANLFKISFGGLFHDIGKKEIDPDLLLKSRAQLSYKERQLIETHPLRGKEILETLKSAPSEVVAIAYQHHENGLGHGFPQQLGRHEIHPMAKVVAVANEFCNYALKGPHNPAIPGVKAIGIMKELKADGLDPSAFRALQSLFDSKARKK